MDRKLFEKEILPMYKRMFAVCITIVRDKDEASDAVQEAFAKLWEHRYKLDNVNSYEAYAMTTVKRVCISRLRSRNIQNDTLDNVNEPSTDSNIIEDRSEVELVKKLMGRLPANHRMILTLSSIGLYSNQEIAEITCESEANVRQMLSRARKKLKELYQRYNQ